MSGGREYEERRLAELIMFIANRTLGDPMFGATKLNKVLFFSDFEAYRRTGRSITGAVYQRLDQGPCAQQFKPALRSLGEDVREVRRQTPAGTRHELVPLRDADVAMFSGPEVALVGEIIDWLRPMTARQASDQSHETMAWLLSEDRGEVPYGTAVLSRDQPSDEDRAWLEEVALREGMARQAR